MINRDFVCLIVCVCVCVCLGLQCLLGVCFQSVCVCVCFHLCMCLRDVGRVRRGRRVFKFSAVVVTDRVADPSVGGPWGPALYWRILKRGFLFPHRSQHVN